MDRIIVEVGSTCTKVNGFFKNRFEKLEGKTIEFKKHYHEDKMLKQSDVKALIQSINDLKLICKNIYVCGTSIFRSLQDTEKEIFLNQFKKETGFTFNIVSQEKESELTVLGATKFINQKVCVFIGGGGSTEISIYDQSVIENVNTNIGVIDVMEKYPDLAENFARTDLEEIKQFIKKRLHLPKEKADVLILAGGGHEKFARLSGMEYQSNTLYHDSFAPIMMDLKTRINETKRFYQEISLDEIRNRVSDPDWWYSTRAMTAFVLVLAEQIDAKYIVPTDIAMAHGLFIKGV